MATVIPTEEAIGMLADDHRPPRSKVVKDLARVMSEQGLIEPIYAVGHVIDNYDDPYDIARVYAAVELGWDTVLVIFVDQSSG